jgi:hypothetical protein
VLRKEVVMPRSDWGGGIRWDVHVRDCCRCVYCGLDTKLLANRWDLFTTDHLVPDAAGGPYSVVNLVTACLGCNALKSGFDPTNNGTDPLTEESRERLIQRGKEDIETKRRKWHGDAVEMQSQAERLRRDF